MMRNLAQRLERLETALTPVLPSFVCIHVPESAKLEDRIRAAGYDANARTVFIPLDRLDMAA